MMSKLVEEPVKVQQTKDSMITTFMLRSRLYLVVDMSSWLREPSE